MDPGLAQKLEALRSRFTADNRTCGVRKDLFSIRTGLVEEAIRILDQDGVICIRAPRECGKTTLANSIANRLHNERGFSVSHEPFTVFTIAFTNYQLLCQMANFHFDLNRLGRALVVLRESDLFILDDCPTAQSGMKGARGEGLFRAVVRAHDSGKKIVLLTHRSFDPETDEPRNYGLPRFFPKLQTLDLPFAFTKEEASVCVTQELANTGFVFSEPTLEGILSFSSGFPVVLLGLCNSLIQYWSDLVKFEDKVPRVSPDGRSVIEEDVDWFWEKNFVDEHRSLARLYSSLSGGLSKKEKSILVELLELGPEDFAPLANSKYVRELGDLDRLGVVFKEGDSYELPVPVMLFLGHCLRDASK